MLEIPVAMESRGGCFEIAVVDWSAARQIRRWSVLRMFARRFLGVLGCAYAEGVVKCARRETGAALGTALPAAWGVVVRVVGVGCFEIPVGQIRRGHFRQIAVRPGFPPA